MPQLIQEKYEQIRGLINRGRERGHLLYDELNDVLPAEVHSSEEIDTLLSTLDLADFKRARRSFKTVRFS